MAATLTTGEQRAMETVTEYAKRAAWIYLTAGILAVLFGAVVLSLALDWIGLFTLALLIGGFLMAWGWSTSSARSSIGRSTGPGTRSAACSPSARARSPSPGPTSLCSSWP